MTKLWFKRKRFGWGWTPITWQGWVVTLSYVAIIVGSALTINGNSPRREMEFTFALPIIIATITMFRICYAKGERPKWTWGEDMKDKS